MVIATNARSTHIVKVRGVVYKAVEEDGLSLNHTASVFEVNTEKSAAKNIVLGGPYQKTLKTFYLLS